MAEAHSLNSLCDPGHLGEGQNSFLDRVEKTITGLASRFGIQVFDYPEHISPCPLVSNHSRHQSPCDCRRACTTCRKSFQSAAVISTKGPLATASSKSR